MDSLARKLKLQNTCAKDLSLGNPLVAEALDGFNNYRLMRSAGCQRSNSTGNYCFADAATKEDPSDLYLYYLVSLRLQRVVYQRRVPSDRASLPMLIARIARGNNPAIGDLARVRVVHGGPHVHLRVRPSPFSPTFWTAGAPF